MKRKKLKVLLSLILVISLLTPMVMFSDTINTDTSSIDKTTFSTAANDNATTEAVVNTTTPDPVANSIATGSVITVQPQDTNNLNAAWASQQAANQAFVKAFPVIRKLNSNKKLTEEEIQLLCTYFQIDRSEIDSKKADGRKIKDIIYAIVIVKFGFSEQEADKLIKNSGDSGLAYHEVMNYEAFLKAEKISENEIAEIRNMLIEGHNMANVISAFELASALGIDMNTFIENDKEIVKVENRTKKLLKRVGKKYGEKDFSKLIDIAKKYSVDMDKLLQYIESIGMNVDELETKINDNIASKKSSGVDTLSVSALAAESTSTSEDINKYLNPPFDVTRYEKAYVNPASGSFNYQDTDLTLPGRNGLDLSITIRYNSAQAALYKEEFGSAFPDTYEELQNNIGSGWSLGFSSVELHDPAPYTHVANTHLEDGTLLQGWSNERYFDSRDTDNFTNGVMTSKYKIVHKDGKKEYFGSDGRLLGIVDRYGNKILFKHTIIKDHPVISEITDTLGRVVTFKYNITATGKELVITAPGGRTIRYISDKLKGYDNEYVLSKKIDTQGRITQFNYNIDSGVNGYYEGSEVTNYYANMTKVIYPTLAYKENQYIKLTCYRSSHYSQHYRVQTTEDNDKGIPYNRTTYSYMGADTAGYATENDLNGYRYYYYTTTISCGDKITKADFSVDDNVKMKETVTSASGDYNSCTQYLYYMHGKEPRPSKIVTTTYNPQNSSVQTVKTVLNTYNEYGDLCDTTDERNFKTVYTYDPNFHVITSKRWILIIENKEHYRDEYEEHNVNPITGNVDWVKKHYSQWTSQGDVTKQIFTEYLYDDYGNMTTEKINKDDGSYIQYNYEYSKEYDYGYLTRKYTNVKDYNGVSRLVEEKYAYDFNTGNLKSYTDANVHMTTYQYDNLGRPTLVTNPDSTTINVAYNDIQNIVTVARGTVTDKYKYQTRNIYDGFGKLIKLEEFKGGIWVSLGQKHYDAFSNMDWSMDANNNATSYQYDSLGRLIKTINPDTTFTTIAYDDGERSKTETNEDGDKHYYYYDLKGNRIKEATIPDRSKPTERNETDYWYNFYGEIEGIGYQNRWDSIIRDGLGRIVSVRNETNRVETKYEYDVLNNITKMTVPEGGVTQYFYDELGRLIKTIDPLLHTEYRAYDGVGNLTKIVDRKGQTTIMTYDLGNRLKTKTVGNISVTYNYDKYGNLESIIDKNGTTSYQYYADGKLWKEIAPDGKSICYAYNNNGDRTMMTDQFVKVTRYTYDSMNRLKTVSIDGLTTTYDYYPDGTRLNVKYPGGIKEEFTYDGVNNLKSVVNKKADGTIINQYGYTYDIVGNQETKTDASGKTVFSYDFLNRIETVTEPDGTKTTYGYDNNNNTKSKTIVTSANVTKEAVSYIYDQNDRLTNVSDTITAPNTVKTLTNTYDDNGNLTNTNRITQVNGATTANVNMVYGYNEVNQMKDYTAANGTKTTFAYNQKGLRKSKTIGANTTGYYYDGENVVIETLNSAFSARNIRGTSLIGRQDKAGLISYYLFNGHGDVVNLVDKNGYIKSTYDYDIYGKKKVATENGVANPARYAGEYYDDESGMYYLRARYYDPEMMRFISEDTNKGKPDDPMSLNLYAYCQGNPIKYCDPSGNGPELAALLIPGVGEIVIGAAVVAGGTYAVYEGGKWLGKKVGQAQAEKKEQEKKKKDEEAKENGEPREDHTVVTEGDRLDVNGAPNSSTDLLNPDGSVKQRRYYGPDGKAEEDIDYNHNDSNHTHEFPHRHKWDWTKKNPRQDWIPMN